MATFPPDIEAYVQQKISSGEFRTPEEFALAAMRVYRQLEAQRAELKSDIQAAIEESERGLSGPLDIEAIKAELRAEWDARGCIEP